MDVDALRRALGGEFAYRRGHWFCVDHEYVARPDGRPFSHKRGGSGRRVVLATAHGPNATLFARSASVPAAFEHRAHDHDGGPARCRLDEDGWINFRIPVSVPARELCDRTYSCEEPAGSQLYDELERRVRL